MSNKTQRGTIFLESVQILSHQHFEGDQYVLQVHAPRCAAAARAGQFAHLQCDPSLAMRRPLSIMRCNPATGRVDFLYKVVGRGTRMLAMREPGEQISLLGPIGQPFRPDPLRSRPLLLGGGVGIPPMVFLSEELLATRGKDSNFSPLVLMGSEAPFPFTRQPSRIMVPGIPDGIIARLEHYFLTYKTMPGEEDRVRIPEIYGHAHAIGVVAAAMNDYEEHYGG
jgi:dihydroorotate dehydrogenase electron transfer subunit